jgi:hypothetical protein
VSFAFEPFLFLAAPLFLLAGVFFGAAFVLFGSPLELREQLREFLLKSAARALRPTAACAVPAFGQRDAQVAVRDLLVSWRLGLLLPRVVRALRFAAFPGPRVRPRREGLDR